MYYQNTNMKSFKTHKEAAESFVKRNWKLEKVPAGLHLYFSKKIQSKEVKTEFNIGNRTLGYADGRLAVDLVSVKVGKSIMTISIGVQYYIAHNGCLDKIN